MKFISDNMFAENQRGTGMLNKRFEKLLLKNTLAIALPAVAVLLVLFLLLTRFSVFSRVKSVDVDEYENYEAGVEKLYENEATNVTATLKDLYYTGFDYYVDGKIKGAYYYSMDGDKFCLFLINTNKPEMFIESVHIKGKIIKDNIAANHIIDKLTEKNNLDRELLRRYCFDYIISEPDYPRSYILMLNVFFAVPIVLAILIILYTILIWFNPGLHSQCKQLEQYGEIEAIIEEIDNQLKNQLVFKKSHIYITRDYMIVNYFHRTDVIKLDYIKYLSKNLVEKKEFISRAERVYRLTMSDPETIFYEVDFVSEEFIDDVVGYIRGVNKKEKSS